MTTISFTTELTLLHCASCGVPFGLTADFEQRRRDDHERFYCPSGHVNVYGQKSEVEKRAERLARQLEEERRCLASREEDLRAERASHAATKGKLTKTRKRVAGGACPCCNRTFVELGRHMATKHPDFVAPVAP